MTRFQRFSAAPTSATLSDVPLSQSVFELWVSRSGKSTFTSDRSESLQSRSSSTDSATPGYIAFYYAFRTLVPLPHHRTPWSWSNAHWALLPFLPLGFMAYLVRRRDTFVMRLLLLAYGDLPCRSFRLRVRISIGLRDAMADGISCGFQILLAPTMASGI
jgi:hypothetical protein